ncbi:MAG: hypothetical protein ACKPJJ_37240, partial [Planctomycetaceae bacterium]
SSRTVPSMTELGLESPSYFIRIRFAVHSSLKPPNTCDSSVKIRVHPWLKNIRGPKNIRGQTHPWHHSGSVG